MTRRELQVRQAWADDMSLADMAREYGFKDRAEVAAYADSLGLAPRPEPVGWTDERVQALKTAWADGKTPPAIAKQLGGVTRAAVIGKARRLGLPMRAQVQPTTTKASRPAPVAAVALSPPAPPRKADPNAFTALEGSAPAVSAQGCQWPIGTAPPGEAVHLRCCLPKQPADPGDNPSPYCERHHAMAYQPRVKRAPPTPSPTRRAFSERTQW